MPSERIGLRGSTVPQSARPSPIVGLALSWVGGALSSAAVCSLSMSLHFPDPVPCEAASVEGSLHRQQRRQREVECRRECGRCSDWSET